MSKSVQDYKSFAAHAKSDRGSIRHDLRLYAKKVLGFLFVLSVSFTLSSVSMAQPVVIDWDGANQGVDGYSEGGILTGGGYVSGRPANINLGRPGYWQVLGSLGVDGRAIGVEFLDTLDVQGTLSVYEGKTIQEVTTIDVAAGLNNYGTLLNGNYGTPYTSGGFISVAGELYNSNLNTSIGVIRNYQAIQAGSIRNYGTIETAGILYIDAAQGIVNGYNSITRNRGDALIRTIEGDEYTSGIYIGVDLNQTSTLTSFIKPVASLTQYFDGAIRADYGEIHVSGTLYNAGEISIYPTSSNFYLETEEDRWTIYAGTLHNDGRLWSQAASMETMSGLKDAALGMISDARINTSSHLINQGANAVINGSVKPTYIVTSDPNASQTIVNTNLGRSMHVGGDLNNLDRASIFNYREIIVHNDLLNRGATLVGGHWYTHSNFNELGDLITGDDGEPQMDNEHPLRYQSGLINVGGNVNNISEKAVGGDTYGGVIASFDTFQARGSLYNDADSLITGSYEHIGTAPGGGNNGLAVDPDDPDGPGISVPLDNAINGRRASIVGGVVFKGEYDDAASQLIVKGLLPESESLPTETPFQGLYNEGHIREIDIITVGSDENAVLYNAAPAATPRAQLAAGNGGLSPNTVNGLNTAPAGTIIDIGQIRATNLLNAGTISDIDASIDISYSMVNTGTLDGISNSHVEWTYGVDGSPLAPVVVPGETRASLHVGESTAATNPLTASMATAGVGIGIVNDGIIRNFEHVTSRGNMYHGMSGVQSTGSALIDDVTSITVGSNIGLGNGADMYIAGSLSNVDSVNVTNNLYLHTGSDFANVGTITADNNVYINGVINGGFSILSAKGAALQINSMASGGLTDGRLTIDQGAVASGNAVDIYGTVENNGQLTAQTSVTNRAGASVINNGTISSASNFNNYGDISGKGMVFVGTDGKFYNQAGGSISGGLAVNGGFENVGGTIKLINTGDVIRVTNGTATIRGGSIDASAYTNSNATVGGQYLFLSTETRTDSQGRSSAGNLDIRDPLKANLSGTTGTVLDFAPVYGTWDGTKYVAGEQWGNNQYYWFEVQRAYTYANQAATLNQEAVGKYIDTVGAKVNGTNQTTGLWNMLRQLDGLSDSQAVRTFDPNYADHQGDVNPLALAALDQMSGQIYATMGVTSVHNTGVVNTTLAETLRSDVFKFSFIGNPNNAVRGQAIAPLRYNRWGTLFGVAGSTSSDGNSSGYDQSFGGMMAGIDRSFWTGTRLGAFLSVGAGEVTLEDIVQERTKTVDVMIGTYLRQEMYFGYGLMVGGFGHDTYKTTRNLSLIGHNAESRTHATIGSMYLERGIDLPVYYATLQPFASFQAVSVMQDEFTETMWDQTGKYTNVGLEGVEGKTSSFKMGLGLRGSSRPVPLQWGQLALTANMAWYHEFAGDQDRDFITKFTNPSGSNFDTGLSDATFRIYGNDPKQDWFNFGWGLHLDRNSTRFFLDANLYTNSRQTLFTGNGGIVTSW